LVGALTTSYFDNTAGKGEAGLCKVKESKWQDTVIDGIASCEPDPGYQTYAQRDNPHVVGECGGVGVRGRTPRLSW
jgi:hypothetical protein